ncbi:MAG: hypothetical protein QM293_00640 [Bacteroidota bacterium]|nr:hypothetical protein [Bacteroidota bacterium]
MSSTNGKRFINPTLEEQFSPKISDVFKMRRERRDRWHEYGAHRQNARINLVGIGILRKNIYFRV